MIVISIGDIIAWVIGGIALVVVLALLLIDFIEEEKLNIITDLINGVPTAEMENE